MPFFVCLSLLLSIKQPKIWKRSLSQSNKHRCLDIINHGNATGESIFVKCDLNFVFLCQNSFIVCIDFFGHKCCSPIANAKIKNVKNKATIIIFKFILSENIMLFCCCFLLSSFKWKFHENRERWTYVWMFDREIVDTIA